MKLGLYLRYATRSLIRGGQRTLLAVFCVAVGVMAIVALQLVGNMVNLGLTSNVRDGNGGDISVRSDVSPLSADELTVFDSLKASGTITDYTAMVGSRAQAVDKDGNAQFFSLRAVDPAKFPLSGQPYFRTPANATLSTLLTGNSVVITANLSKDAGLSVGDTITVHSSDGRTLDATVAGIVESQGFFRASQMLVAQDAYAALKSTSGLPPRYSAVYVNVPGHTDANAATAKKAIEQQLASATVTTTKDALQNNQQQVQNIRYFLQVVGLLALLIGGIGIVNTMQVLLRRRQVEIAMLKTTGFQRTDLYFLFGLEAAILGLAGGLVGSAAGTGVAFFVKGLVEKAFFITLPSDIDPLTVGSGLAIGFFTALIFGILPIVQASQIRPLAVLRGITEGVTNQSRVLTLALGALLAGLFLVLAWTILRSWMVAIAAVTGTGVFLLVLALIFAALVAVISRMPIPERMRWWIAVPMVVLLAAAIAFYIFFPQIGLIPLLIVAVATLLVLLPRTGRANVKIALRNIGRAQARTVTTLVALFVGVFAIGVILALGQGIKDQINTILSNQADFNAFLVANDTTKSSVDVQVAALEGIKGQQVSPFVQDRPVAVNDIPMGQIVAGVSNNGGLQSLGKQGAYEILGGVQGYTLTAGDHPDISLATPELGANAGRLLDASDAGTANIVLPEAATMDPLKLKVNDKITLASFASKTPTIVTVVGFYDTKGLGAFFPIISDESLVKQMSPANLQYFYALKLDPDKAEKQVQNIQNTIPGVQGFALVELTLLINNLLNNLIIMLTAIASLALLAGLIIIANAVALAMLERRRELGIIKSVGFTSRSVLSQVLVENAVVAFTGAMLAIGLVVAALLILDKALFQIGLTVSAGLVLSIVGGVSLVCIVVAALVAWSATRVRPVEVLRYE